MLRHRWLHGCDPQQPSAERPQQIVRIVVCGMEASGKSSFLRALAPDQQVRVFRVCRVVSCVSCCVSCVSCRVSCVVWRTVFPAEGED